MKRLSWYIFILASLVGFISISFANLDLIPPVKEADALLTVIKQVSEDADDMSELGKFFTKYGDEAGRLLKKFGDDLADEAFEVYKKGGDLKRTKGITKGVKGVAWLEEGNNTFGWKHIFGRHIDGTLEVNKSATFFPTGKTIERATPNTLPSAMKDSEVEELIYESVKKVKNPEISGDKLKYVYKPSKYGIDEMWTITTQDGKIISSYPTKGSTVWKWDVDKQIWELQQ